MTYFIFLYLWAVIPLLLFIYRYARYSPWSTTQAGWTLMGQKVTWVVLFIHLIARSIFDYPGWQVVEVIIIFSIAVLFWLMFLTLYDAQTSPGLKPKTKRGLVPEEDIEKTNPPMLNWKYRKDK